VRRLLRSVLEPYGYRVFEAENGVTGLTQAVECEPDVIILETVLPDREGLTVLQGLREWSNTPVLVLSEQSHDAAKVAALDAGASDYMTKPFSSAELLARLRVLQRPVLNEPDGPFLIEGELVANLVTHEITLSGRAVRLTRKEEALFYVLARYAGKVVTRTHLLRSVWGAHGEQGIHDLQVLIAQLRKKLEPYGAEILIRTEGHIGYRLSFMAPSEAALSVADSDSPSMTAATLITPGGNASLDS
jgi:two-component system, OmpR family, KDP operon response regulator KdpE